MERKRSVRQRPRKQRNFYKKCKDVFRQFIAFLFSNVGIIGLVVSYTIAGAFIFQRIEQEYHKQIKDVVAKLRFETAVKLFNMTLKMNQEDPFDEHRFRREVVEELRLYQINVTRFVTKGYDGADEDYSKKWSFAGAFLYSLTVITTIGYGNITPHTMEGKISTIIYAIIGMPLFLLYLSNIGDILARSFKWIYANLCLCRWCPGVAKRREDRKKKRRAELEYYDEEEGEEEGDEEGFAKSPRGANQRHSIASEASEAVTDALSEESYDVQAVTVPVTICLTIMVGYICGGAWLFCRWEDWEFLDASYFCFISLSTIGFGDLVPGDEIYGRGGDFMEEVFNLSFVFCSMYLMLGMALIAMCFNLMQEEVIHKIRTTVRTVKYVLRCDR